MDSALDPKNPQGIRTPLELVSRVEAEDPETGRVLRREMASFQPRFIVNQIRDIADIAIGHQLVAACGRHLGLRATYAGYVHHDDAVWRACGGAGCSWPTRPPRAPRKRFGSWRAAS